MARSLTDHQSHLEHRLSTSQELRKTSQQHISLGLFLGCVLRAEKGWPGNSMIADYEDLHETESAENNVKRFKYKELFVKEPCELSCPS